MSSVAGTVVHALDFDLNACRVYAANFGSQIVSRRDISTLEACDISSLEADLWLMSPSCQPYTALNPNAQAEKDPRAQSFIHLLENVLPELSRLGCLPTHILIENVAGFESSSTRKLLLSVLQQLDYSICEFLLTPLQFGIPNSRLRYYLVARFPLPFLLNSVKQESVLRAIPSHLGYSGEATEVHQLRYYLDEHHQTAATDGIFSAIPDKVLERWGRLFDIVLPSDRRSCCFTRGYTHLVEGAGSVLQMNESLSTTTTFDEFFKAQKSEDPNALSMLRPLRLRYFSPDELLRLFHLLDPDIGNNGDSFKWPPDITTKTKYRLIGNSVNVKVVARLLDFLYS